MSTMQCGVILFCKSFSVLASMRLYLKRIRVQFYLVRQRFFSEPTSKRAEQERALWTRRCQPDSSATSKQ